MLASHYAPRAEVVLVESGDGLDERVAREVDRGAVGGRRVAVLAPEALSDLPGGAVELEPTGPPEDYARVLYDRLRQADRLGGRPDRRGRYPHGVGSATRCATASPAPPTHPPTT